MTKSRKYRLDELNLRELRKLSKALKETEKKAWSHRLKKREEFEDAIDSCDKLWRLIKRVEYYYGKARAKGCPAFRHTANATGKCLVNHPVWESHFTRLFERCVECTLPRKKALIQGTFNGVFNDAKAN